MPRVTYLKTTQSRTEAALAQLKKITPSIKGRCGSANKLKDVLGVTQPTAQKWLSNPEQLTLDQIVRIAVFYDRPRDEIISKICW